MTHLNWDNTLEPMLAEFTSATENEHNWQSRQNFIKKLKGLLTQNNGDVPRNFWDKTKQIIPCIITTAGSERTQLSKEACELLGVMFQSLGSGMHPYMESTLPTLLQICGSAKRQNQLNGNSTMTVIIQFAGYHHRLLYHICATFNDKRKDARANGPGWLTLFLRVYQHSLDATKDYPMIERALATGLSDGDVKTREGTRETYWQYFRINEPAADVIMETLNSHASHALRSDKNNPHKTAAPVKAARSESALAKIRAQKQKAAAMQAPTEPKRDISNSSTISHPFINGTFVNDSDGISKAETFIDPRERKRLDAEHKAHAKQGVRNERTPNYDSRNEQLMKKPSKPTMGEMKEIKGAELPPNEPETATSSRPFLSAPVRRPRVVATPISQPQPTSRPTSKGEPTKRSEPRDRPQPGRTGRQTPIMAEEQPSESQHRASTKSHKPSVRAEHKFTTSTSTPTQSSSSSEPAGIKSPRGHTQQSASISVLPDRRQKSSSTSEPKGHTAAASTGSSIDYSKLKTMSPPGPVKLPFSRPETLASSVTSSHKSIDYSKLKQMSPPGPVILPLPAKENPVEPFQGKASADDALGKAKRSLPAIIEALKEGKLDALGYRKLRKLIMTYPGQLFTDGGVDDQYDALYRALISQFSSVEEAVEPREQKRANLNHPMYTRMAVIDMLHFLMMQYPYGEPTPGMTLIALLVAKASYEDSRLQVDDKIRSSMIFFLTQIVERYNPLPVIDSITDALFELSDVMLSNEPEKVATPTWQRMLNLSTTPKFFKSSSGESVMSHLSEFGPNPPKVPNRLPQVMETGLILLTELIINAREKGYQLFEVQQERLVDLLTVAITTYRHLFKKQIMEFATALFDIIKPEQRFKSLFKDEGDLNLVYYCIGKVREQQGRHLGGPILGDKPDFSDGAPSLDSWGLSTDGGGELSTF